MTEMEDIFKRTKGKRESSTIEYKLCKLKLSKDLWETVSAFSNTKDGLILLGYEEIKDRYVPIGVKNPSQVLDDFSSLVGQKFNFCPLVRADILEDGGKAVILIEVKEALVYQKPVYIKDAGPIKGGFKRVGAADIRLTDSDIERYYQARMGSPDATTVDSITIKDVDERTVSIFKELRKLIKPDAPEIGFSTNELLKTYDLLCKDGKTLNAAGVLLFGAENAVKRCFPAMRLDIIRIKGTEWGKDKDPFLSQDLKGNLLDIRMRSLDLINRFYLVQFKLGKGLARTEENPFTKAIREAVNNLLMHQNYFHYSPAQVRVYNDRIEFYNPGYSLKDPKDFNEPGSELRNPLIASVFYDIGWAEAKGTGFRTTILELSKEGYPQPKWENNKKQDTFTLSFFYPSEKITDQVADQVADQVEVRDRMAKLLKFCEEPRSLKEMLEFLRLKHRPNFRKQILHPLLEKGYIRRTIPDKPSSRFQKYVAVKKGEK